MRVLKLCIALATSLAISAPIWAQDDQSLADIRAELGILHADIQLLRQELVSTGNVQSNVDTQGLAQMRLDQVEQELRRLTGQVENLEFRIGQIVKDGTNRIGDLEFRLVELEGGDVTALGQTSTLGGETAATVQPGAVTQTSNIQLAVAEQSDYNAAIDAYKAGDYLVSADRFKRFADTYPGGPLTGEAKFWRGEALFALDDWKSAARSYLESFTDAPAGTAAPMALHKLGVSLARLGKKEQACTMLKEVSQRYPGSDAVDPSLDEIGRLGCF